MTIRQVLLSAKTDPKDSELAIRQLQNLRYPVMASPKIDGIRCHIEGDRDSPIALSRKNKMIPNFWIQSVLSQARYLNFDGELTVRWVRSK